MSSDDYHDGLNSCLLMIMLIDCLHVFDDNHDRLSLCLLMIIMMDFLHVF